MYAKALLRGLQLRKWRPVTAPERATQYDERLPVLIGEIRHCSILLV